MSALEVVQLSQILNTRHSLVLHEEVNPIDSHGFEKAAKLEVSDYRNQVF